MGDDEVIRMTRCPLCLSLECPGCDPDWLDESTPDERETRRRAAEEARIERALDARKWAQDCDMEMIP
jgi:hypothetical protein